MTSKLLLAVLVLATSACSTRSYLPVAGPSPAPGTPATNAPNAAQGMPQSANSLPPGARVNAPLVRATGAIKTTRVQ